MTDSLNVTAFLKANVDDFTRGMAQAQKSMSDLTRNKGLKGFGQTVSGLGKSLALGVTTPLVSLGAAGVKAFSDYDTALVGVAKTTDMSGEKLEKFSKEIMSLSGEMPVAATELANIAEAAGQLGIEEKNLIGFTKTMAQLATATNMTSEEASMSLAQFANVTQMSQKDFDKLGSVIVELGNNMATTESDIVSMASYLAGTGSQIGLTEAEIMALSAAMSSVGINAEAGGGSFSRIMQKMNSEVLGGGENLAGFAKIAGQSSEEFAKAWKENPKVAITDFVKGLDEMSKNGEDVAGTLKDLGITSTQELDTLLKLAGAGELLGESFEMANNAWDDGTALSKEAQTAYKSFANQLKVLKNSLFEAAVAIGGVLAPYIAIAANYIKDLVDKFNSLDDATKDNIVKWGLIIAAIGPVLFIFGKMMSLIGGLAGAFKLLGKFSPFKKKGPLGGKGTKPPSGRSLSQWLGLAAAILAVGAAIYVSAKAFEVMANSAIKLNEAGLGAQLMFAGMLVGLGALVAVFGVFAKSLTTGAVGMLAFGATFLLISAGIALIATQGEGLKAVFEGIGNAIGTMVTAIAGGMATIIGAVATGASQIITAFTPIAQIISDTIIGVTEAIAPFIPAITEMVSSVVAQLPKIIAAFSGLVGEVGGAISQIIAAVSDLVAQIGPVLESAGQMFKDMGTGIKTALDGVSGIIEEIGNAVEKSLGGIEGIITAVGDSAIKMGDRFKVFSEGLIAIGNADLNLSGIAGGITALAGSMKLLSSSGIEVASSGMQGISQALANTFGVSALAGDFTALGESLGGFPDISSIGQQLGTLGSSLATIFGVSALAGDFTALGTALGSIFRVSALAGDFKALGESLSGFPAGNSIGSTLQSIGASLKNIFGVSALAGDFTALKTALTGFGSVGSQFAVVGVAVVLLQTQLTQFSNQVKQAVNTSKQAVLTGMSGMVTAMASGGSRMVSTAQSISSRVVNVFNQLASKMRTAGVNAGNGFNNGLASTSGAILATANRIASQVASTIQKSLDIHSPSRLLAWMGRMVGQGLINGMSAMVSGVQSVSELMANAAMPNIGDMALGNFSGGVITHELSADTTQTNMMAQLIDEVRNGQIVVLDTGQVVGGTKDKMDNALGQNGNLGSRWSMS